VALALKVCTAAGGTGCSKLQATCGGGGAMAAGGEVTLTGDKAKAEAAMAAGAQVTAQTVAVPTHTTESYTHSMEKAVGEAKATQTTEEHNVLGAASVKMEGHDAMPTTGGQASSSVSSSPASMISH
jgi:hypothetical protein